MHFMGIVDCFPWFLRQSLRWDASVTPILTLGIEGHVDAQLALSPGVL